MNELNTPKIKLTLKIPTIGGQNVTTTPNTNLSKDIINDSNNNDSFKSSKKKGSNISTPLKQIHVNDPNTTGSVSSFIKQMKSFKSRHWQLQDQRFITLPNSREFIFVGWRTMEGSSRYDVSISPKKKNSKALSSSQGNNVRKDKSIKEGDFISTFVCAFEACHRIFDSKNKWRRHQLSHKKKKNLKEQEENNFNHHQDQESSNVNNIPTSEVNMEMEE